jgi:hypothetical protein
LSNSSYSLLRNFSHCNTNGSDFEKTCRRRKAGVEAKIPPANPCAILPGCYAFYAKDADTYSVNCGDKKQSRSQRGKSGFGGGEEEKEKGGVNL